MITLLISLCVIAFMVCMVIGGWLFVGQIGIAMIIAVIAENKKKK